MTARKPFRAERAEPANDLKETNRCGNGNRAARVAIQKDLLETIASYSTRASTRPVMTEGGFS
jgi:hypothetical protein